MTNQMKELWIGFSTSRLDSMTRVGGNFDPLYDGYKGLIGYIWPEQDEGMVPLYTAWSPERLDTRTQVGDKFESIYYSGMSLLGYIYKEDKGGMVPLWSRFSTSRSDTATKVGDDWDPIYDGGKVFLGYIRPPGKIVVKSIEFPTLESVVPKDSPVFNLVQTYVNRSSVKQSGDITFEFEKRNEYTFAWENATKIGVELRFKTGIPTVIEAGVKVSVEDTFTFGETHTMEEKEGIEASYPLEVPPHSSLTLKATLFQGTLNLPFVATLAILNSDATLSRTWQERGTYNNVTSTRSLVKASKTEVLAAVPARV